MPKRKRGGRGGGPSEGGGGGKAGRKGGKKHSAEPTEEEVAAARAARDEKKQRRIQRELGTKPGAIDLQEPTITTAVGRFESGNNAESSSEGDCVKIDTFSLAFRGEELLSNTSLKLSVGRRYGLVGPNGSGKSTLVRCIAGRKLPGIPTGLQILHVEQEVEGGDESAVDAVLLADTERNELLEKVAAIEAKMEEFNEREVPEEEAAKKAMQEEEAALRVDLEMAYEGLQAIGADAAPARAAGILAGLQFTPTMQKMATKEFSGGWRMRISLARALFLRPSLLLLDEPTNHLDLHALVWLETYLQMWKKTLLIVSHDKNFLNTVCTDIIHLHDQRLIPFRGNFDKFQQIAKQHAAEQLSLYKKKTALEQEIKKLRSGDQSKASQGQKKKSKSRIDPETRNKLIKKKEQQLAGMDDIRAPLRDYSVTFSFPDPEHALSHPVIQVQDVSFAYPLREGQRTAAEEEEARKKKKPGKKSDKKFMAKDGARPGEDIFRNLNFGLDMESRIALVGRNGAGKTTLLHLLAKHLAPTQGSVGHAYGLRIGWFAQHFADLLDPEMSPVQYLHDKYPDEEYQNLRKHLGMFGLPGKRHNQMIRTLSGGEKNRVIFASLALYQPHILFLDEPTNHLDMESIEALVESLDRECFSGGVILVSHDQRLIDSACEEIWIVDDMTVERYDGDIYDYRDELISEMEFEGLEVDDE